MNSIRHILVLSTRKEFCDALEDASDDFYDIRLELAVSLERTVDVLEELRVDVVVVDDASESDTDAVMDELVSVFDATSPTPLLCFVGEVGEVEMEASLVFNADASAEELLGHLSGVPAWSQNGSDETFESGEQPRFVVPDSGFRQPATSGLFTGLVQRLLYVGDRSEFRQGLAAQAESQGVELILRDDPGSVLWPKGAQSLSIVAIEVEEDPSEARELVRYLRERHSDGDFRVAFIADDEQLSQPVAELLGADYLLDAEQTPSDLFRTVFSEEPAGIAGRMLVVSSRNGLIRTIETVLGSEGMVVDVRRRTEEILVYVDESEPDIIVFDTGSRALEAEQMAWNLLNARPRLRSRILGVRSSIPDEDSELEEISTTDIEPWDLTVDPPVSGAELRRAVSLLTLDAERGRRRVERDELTRVRRAPALADAIATEMALAADHDENLLIVGLDLDDLSLLNVRYSWELGDAVLRTLADMLSVAVGGRENVFRHDDMFFVVRRCDADVCQTIRGKIEDFIDLFQRQTFRSDDGRGTYATVSGGAVIIPPLDIPAETVLEKCWIVLERACSSRKNKLLVAQLDPESFPGAASRKQPSPVKSE